MPSDWLLTVSVSDPVDLVDKLEAALGQLGQDANLVQPLRALEDPRLQLDSGQVLLGFAAPSGDLTRLYPFAMIPTPVELVVQLLRGEMTDEIGVGSLGGLEVAARRVDGVTYVVPLVHQQLLTSQPSAPLQAIETAQQVQLSISQLGLDALRQRVADRGERGPGERIALNLLGWPPNPRWIDAAIGANQPLAGKLSELFNSVEVGLSIDEHGGVSAKVNAPLKHAAARPAQQATPVALPELDREAIARFSGDARDGSLTTVVELLLAYSQGRPDEIDLNAYPEAGYQQVADATLKAASQVRCLDAALLSRAAGDPLHSNRVAVVRVEDEQGLLEDFSTAVTAWNQLIDDSKTRFQLRISRSEEQLLPDLPPAVVFTTDVAAALDTQPSLEIKEVMQRYYGGEGLHILRAQPLGQGRVLLGDLPREQYVKTLKRAVEDNHAAGQAITGTWDVGRYADWQNAILADFMANAIGFEPRKQLDSAPVRFHLSQTQDQLRLSAEASRETLRQLGRLLTPETHDQLTQ